jgi:hypothetical protein
MSRTKRTFCASSNESTCSSSSTVTSAHANHRSDPLMLTIGLSQEESVKKPEDAEATAAQKKTKKQLAKARRLGNGTSA